MKIGFDLDGVLYPFEWCFKHYVDSAYPGNWDTSVPVTRWEFYEDWGMSLHQFRAIMEEAAARGHLYNSRPPYPDASSVVRWAHKNGHTVHVITHRAEHGAARSTESWLKAYDIPWDTLTFAHDKSIVDADVLIEDRPENLQAWMEKTGKPGVLFTRPWNKDWNPDVDAIVANGHDDYWYQRVGSYEQLRHVLRYLGTKQSNDAIDAERFAAAEDAAFAGETDTPDVSEAFRLAKVGEAVLRELLPETVLEEANRLIYGARQQDYGHPIEDFTRTAGMWSAAFGWEVEPEDVALAMIMVKISREKNRPKRDNAVDIAGYAGTLAMVRERQAEEEVA